MSEQIYGIHAVSAVLSLRRNVLLKIFVLKGA